jgi:phage baseplate assembly protein W
MAYRIPNIAPIDLNQRKAVGVSIPFNGNAVFNSTYTTDKQINSNLINFILTAKGERIQDPSFGTNLSSYIFESITANTLQSLEESVLADVRRYFNNGINIQQFKINAKPDENTITATLTYNYLNNPEQTAVINL